MSFATASALLSGGSLARPLAVRPRREERRRTHGCELVQVGGETSGKNAFAKINMDKRTHEITV